MESKTLFALGLCALIAGVAPASGVTLTDLVGDKDGFGISSLPPVPPDGTNIWEAGPIQGPGDPSFMDLWGYEQDGGAFGSPIAYAHDLGPLPGTVLSASLVIQQAGMGDSRGPWDVDLNGTSIGQIGPASADVLSKVETFTVPPFLVGSTNTVTLTYLDTQVEGFAINFSELTVEAVPEPATLTLLLVGGLAMLRRIRG